MSNNSFFTNFGFKKININEKAGLVKGIFDSVSSKYDIMNDLMSLGMHRFWKHELIKMINPQKGKILLDVGGGTADIALDFLNKGGERAYVLDINYNMMLRGKDKSLNDGYVSSINFINGDAENLPIKSNIIPTYNTAFCIRNVTNIQNALSEAYRVLKPGGKFFCLEFSKVDNIVLSKIYDLWSFNVIPKIGKCITNNEEAYKYLVESIRKFPTQDKFASMIAAAGFTKVGYKSLTFGVVSIHYGVKK